MPRMISADIEASLRQRIEAGDWPDRLPNERDLAAEYGVARNTVRIAIDRIAGDGLLTRKVGQGTFLSRGTRDEFTDLLRRLVGVSPIDMMAVRNIIEPRAAALAATNASAADLDGIAAAHDAARAAETMAGFEHWDGALHQRIFAGSRIELLTHLHAILLIVRSQDLWLQIKRRSFTAERRLAYCAEHAAIVAALRQRDAEAAEAAMRVHLDTVARNLFAGNGRAP